MARTTSKGRPAGLGAAGTALWRSVVDAYQDLDPRELAVLAAACRQADDVALLEALLASDGPVVRGSMGQPRLSAVLTEVRQGRLALGRLLDQLVLPALPEDAKASAGRSRRASVAANARWGRVAQERANREAVVVATEYGPEAVRRGHA